MKYLWYVIAASLIACSPKKVRQFTLLEKSQTNVDFSNTLDDRELDIIEYLYFYNGGGSAIGDLDNDGLPEILFTSNQKANQGFRNLGQFQFENISQQIFDASLETWSTGIALADVNGDSLLDIYISQVSGYKTIPVGHNLLFINRGNMNFEESSKEYGVDFSGFSTHSAFFDYDQDGDLDMYLLNHAVHTVRSYVPSTHRNFTDSISGDKLYQNQLTETGVPRFLDVTAEAGIYSSTLGYGLGIATSDLNRDGWPDIYVSNDFHENDYLYINQQDGTFKEEASIRLSHMSRFSMGSDIGDINDDGQADIFTLDMLPNDPSILMQSGGEDSDEVYSIKLSQGYHHQYSRNTMQLNVNGFFQDAALFAKTYATDWSWSVLIADYDLDATNDLYITNGIVKRPNDLDYINFASNLGSSEYARLSPKEQNKELIRRMPTLQLPNVLFKKQANGQYENKNVDWGLHQKSYSQGAAYGDLDADGDLDLIVNNTNQEAFIYQNNNLSANKSLQLKLIGEAGNSFGFGAKVTLYQAGKGRSKELYTSRGFQSSVEPQLIFGLGQTSTIDSLVVDWGKHRRQAFFDLNLDTVNVLVFENPVAAPSMPATDISMEELPFRHREDNFDDLDVEPLMPYRLSRLGPALAVADVNQDGREDIFVGGAKGQPATLLIQSQDGQHVPLSTPIARDFSYEDVDAQFFDADNDGDQDLLVISGGNERRNPILYQHRLYENLGQGNFQRNFSWLPEVTSNGSVVEVGDFDQDGDADLFIGSMSVPGIFGMNAQSFILKNDGSGHFSYIPSAVLSQLGMVTDAKWFDYQQDGDLDLAIVGHWMPVTILINTDSEFEKIVLKETEGLWNCVDINDINQDGYLDLVAGNLGLNSKLTASPLQPLTLYTSDFDQNDRIESILFRFYNDQQVPFHSRDNLTQQIPELKKRFLSYRTFAKVRSLQDLFPDLDTAFVKAKRVTMLASTVFYGTAVESQFNARPLPNQQAPVNNINIVPDSSRMLIHMSGNNVSANVEQGRYTSQPYALLISDRNSVTQVPGTDKLPSDKEINGQQFVEIAGSKYLLLATNNGPVYKIEIGYDQ